MASQTEGIALLSMYGDDEEEEAVVATEEELAATTTTPIATATTPIATDTAVAELSEDDKSDVDDENLTEKYNKSEYEPRPFDPFTYNSPQPFTTPSPFRSLDDAVFKTLIRSPFPQRTPTPQRPASQSQLSSPFTLTSPSPHSAPVVPPSIQEHLDGQRLRRIALSIVDYAQDEAAMSPDAEAMEIENSGRVVLGVEIHVSDRNNEGTTPVTSQSLTPSSQQEFLQPFDAHDLFKSEATVTEFSVTELVVDEAKASPTVSTNMQIDESLLNFLPTPVATKCSEELQEKINKFLTYKRAGKSFNADLRNRKDYRNPNFLQHAVSYQDIDEIGTCFCKEVFDPHGYDKSDYYDEIEADMKREMERKEQERKKNQKVDFVSGGTQPGGVAPVMKMNAPSPASGVSNLPNNSLPPNTTVGDFSRDCRTNKKSKWDKVDGDNKMPPGGHDNPPSVTVQAAHLTAANAGTGYSAFAQLKRREAEERKSGERKFDKRSS